MCSVQYKTFWNFGKDRQTGWDKLTLFDFFQCVFSTVQYKRDRLGGTSCDRFVTGRRPWNYQPEPNLDAQQTNTNTDTDSNLNNKDSKTCMAKLAKEGQLMNQHNLEGATDQPIRLHHAHCLDLSLL